MHSYWLIVAGFFEDLSVWMLAVGSSSFLWLPKCDSGLEFSMDYWLIVVVLAFGFATVCNTPYVPYALSNQLFKVIYYYVIIVVAKSYRLEIVRQVNNRLEINPINDGLKLIFSDCLRVSVRFQELSISSHYYCLIT
jgi:hypothetical protein